MKKLIVASALVSLVVPIFQLAALDTIPTPVTTFEGLVSMIGYIANVIFTVLLALAVVFILMAAFYYLTAMGAEDKLKKAQSVLVWAAVAVAVALLAKAIPLVVRSIVAG
ncbi:MAG: hypothetical protein HYS57_01515 [Parcubacteria group bacterium]|nr:hypothetical protein [Parcubacteria group bacterium]